MIIEISDEAPQAWKDLLEGLAILSKGQINEISPTYCSHDNMTVCADPKSFSVSELVKLRELGFDADENNLTFESWKFGSA